MSTPFAQLTHTLAIIPGLMYATTVGAQTTPIVPSPQPSNPAASPATTRATSPAPAQSNPPPGVATQQPPAPVRIAPAQQPANGRTANNPAPPGQPAPVRKFPDQPPPQQAAGQGGSNPNNSDRSVPTSQFLNQSATAEAAQQDESQDNGSGGIVDSQELQNDTLNHIHYHYHFDGQNGFVGAVMPGYAPTPYTDPASLEQVDNPMMERAIGPGNPAPMNVDASNMFVANQNPRVRNAGVPTTWNPYLNNGAGMLTYGGAGSTVQGFND